MKTPHPSLNNGIEDGTPCDPMRPPSPAPAPTKQDSEKVERVEAKGAVDAPATNGLPAPYYQDSAVTLYHGDCREIVPMLGRFDLLLTDPPYPNGEGHFIDAVEVARQVILACDFDSQFIFWSEVSLPPCTIPLVATHIWHRTNVNGKIYEPIFQHERDGRKRRSEIHAQCAIFNGAGPGCAEYLGHPTQKPVALMTWLISKTQAQTILDPFAGSGTTGRAAKDLGRKCVLIEREERYCEIAAKRMAQEVFDFTATEQAQPPQ